MTHTLIESPEAAPEIRANFHKDMLAHWFDLFDGSGTPLSSRFRPQLFGGALARTMMLQLDKGLNICSGRIIGESVDSLLQLKASRDDLFQHPSQRTVELIRSLVGWPEPRDRPVYIQSWAARETMSDVQFSALVLPFRKYSDSQYDDIFLVGFEFQENVHNRSDIASRSSLSGRGVSMSRPGSTGSSVGID